MPNKSVSATALIFVLVLALALGTRPAHAYLDPAAGSMILQVLLGGIAGLALFFRLFWRKVLAFFGADRPKKDAPEGR
ncbi:MAG: hypothetical protein F9K18_03205 [Thermoanaerobaculia bacterium]|jgi:hypothetical protein|nr:MAG: hypothetical protein F9K18_03170 [Thermoanaerobaculia bacterium]KAB2968210.1 MAG: hypothetical protein F9K18_03205 [Thermoanaerobaculia bacterium]MBZ0102733.1 hypothetical protein [Thermoanaerobaculia bacterium]